MCIDDPGQVISIDRLGAVVDTAGRRRRASLLLLPDVQVGDWVTVAAGTIVDRLTVDEARTVLDLLHTARDAEIRDAAGAAQVAQTDADAPPPPTADIDQRRHHDPSASRRSQR
jgi:hydrogenase expression/formation protein HypC